MKSERRWSISVVPKVISLNRGDVAAIQHRLSLRLLRLKLRREQNEVIK